MFLAKRRAATRGRPYNIIFIMYGRPYRAAPTDYLNSCNTLCGCWFAWASIACDAC